MEEKKKLLSKFNIKDYKNEFELVLEEKNFDDEAKSLLLSTFYKLDNFYKDYMTVKIDCESKNKYLEDFINLVKTKCRKIEIIKPTESKKSAKYKVDRKTGKIQCIPNENILFYAVNELKEKNYENEKYLLDDFTNKCVNYILSKGMSINDTEPVRDFNGWSWNVQIEDSSNIIYNLIYQNLLILVGYNFLKNNIGKSNIIKVLKNEINSKNISDYGDKFFYDLIEVCIILYCNLSEDRYENCLKYRNKLKNKINMIDSRKESIDDNQKNSADIEDQIRKIDEMLDNITILRSEFQKSLEKGENRYLGLSDFVEAKEREKQRLLNQIETGTTLEKSKKYMSEKDEYKVILSYFDCLKEDKKKINVQSKLVKLEKDFWECFKELIKKAELKKDLFNLVKQLRYYSNVLIKKDKNISSHQQLAKDFEETARELVAKMIANKIIDTGFKSGKLNYEIVKYVFVCKIIVLETIVLKISFLKANQIQVEYYDSKMLEHKEIIDIPFEEEITNRKDKKIKLFKIGG